VHSFHSVKIFSFAFLFFLFSSYINVVAWILLVKKKYILDTLFCRVPFPQSKHWCAANLLMKIRTFQNVHTFVDIWWKSSDVLLTFVSVMLSSRWLLWRMWWAHISPFTKFLKENLCQTSQATLSETCRTPLLWVFWSFAPCSAISKYSVKVYLFICMKQRLFI